MQAVVDNGPGDILMDEGAEPPLQHSDDAIPREPGWPNIEPRPAA